MCAHLTLHHLLHLLLLHFELLFFLFSLKMQLLSLKFQLFFSEVCFLRCFLCLILETISTSSSFSSSSLYSLLLCGSFFPRMRGFTTFSSLRPCGHGFISACKCIFLFWSSFLQPTLCRDGSKEYNSRRSRVFFASVQRNGPLKKEDIL